MVLERDHESLTSTVAPDHSYTEVTKTSTTWGVDTRRGCRTHTKRKRESRNETFVYYSQMINVSLSDPWPFVSFYTVLWTEISRKLDGSLRRVYQNHLFPTLFTIVLRKFLSHFSLTSSDLTAVPLPRHLLHRELEEELPPLSSCRIDLLLPLFSR